MSVIKVHDLLFEEFISKEVIESKVGELANILKVKYHNTRPIFVLVLKGAFFFGADLIRSFGQSCEITNIQVSSYHGTQSTMELIEKLEPDMDLNGKQVILVEDIVDTGITLDYLIKKLKTLGAKDVLSVALLNKPSKRMIELEADLVGFEIPDKFVIGYGLDYNQEGRYLNSIYALKEEE